MLVSQSVARYGKRSNPLLFFLASEFKLALALFGLAFAFLLLLSSSLVGAGLALGLAPDALLLAPLGPLFLLGRLLGLGRLSLGLDRGLLSGFFLVFSKLLQAVQGAEGVWR